MVNEGKDTPISGIVSIRGTHYWLSLLLLPKSQTQLDGAQEPHTEPQ